MPTWLITFLEEVAPLASKVPAAEAVAAQIATELASTDGTADKIIKICGYLETLAVDIETQTKAKVAETARP